MSSLLSRLLILGALAVVGSMEGAGGTAVACAPRAPAAAQSSQLGRCLRLSSNTHPRPDDVTHQHCGRIQHLSFRLRVQRELFGEVLALLQSAGAGGMPVHNYAPAESDTGSALMPPADAAMPSGGGAVFNRLLLRPQKPLQRPLFNLPDAFTRDAEAIGNLLQRVTVRVAESES